MDDPSKGKLHRLKHKLGPLRVPVGAFFLLIALVLAITPLTPGSLIALTIGLEFLDLREFVFDKFKGYFKRGQK